MSETHTHTQSSVCDTAQCSKSELTAAQEQLQSCTQQVAEWKDKYLRLSADLDNVNRRAAKDRALSLYNAQAALLLPLLAIVDDFERALEPQASVDHKTWTDGISMIYQSLVKYLTSVGIEPMKTYDQFDPEQHEALMHVDAQDRTPGSIVSVLQKGYLFKGEVLRHAKVSVAK